MNNLLCLFAEATPSPEGAVSDDISGVVRVVFLVMCLVYAGLAYRFSTFSGRADVKRILASWLLSPIGVSILTVPIVIFYLKFTTSHSIGELDELMGISVDKVILPYALRLGLLNLCVLCGLVSAALTARKEYFTACFAFLLFVLLFAYVNHVFHFNFWLKSITYATSLFGIVWLGLRRGKDPASPKTALFFASLVVLLYVCYATIEFFSAS